LAKGLPSLPVINRAPRPTSPPLLLRQSLLVICVKGVIPITWTLACRCASEQGACRLLLRFTCRVRTVAAAGWRGTWP